MTKPSDTLARLRARSTEAGRFVLPLDPAWADKAHQAYADLRQAEMYEGEERAKRIAAAQASVNDIVSQVGDEAIVFKFRRVGRAQYDEIVSRNPPTEEMIAEDQDKPIGTHRVFNPTAFAVDLIHVSLIDPPLSLEDARQLITGSDDEILLSKGEAEALGAAAINTAIQPPRQLPRELTLP